MKRFLLILVLFGAWSVGWGQEQTEIVINPFGKDEFVTSIKKGNSVKFKINNVNTFRINGTTESKPLDIDFEVSDAFKNFIMPKAENGTDSGENVNAAISQSLSEQLENIINDAKRYNKNLDFASLQRILDEIQKIENIQEKEINQKQAEANFIIKFSSFINKYHDLQQQIAFEEKVSEQIKDSIFVKDTLVLKDNVREYFKTVYGNKSTGEAKKETATTLNNLMIDYPTLQKIYDELNKTLEKDAVVLSGELKSNDKKTTIKIEKAIVSQDRKKYFSEEMAFAKKAFETISDVKNRNEIIKKAQSGIDLYNKIDKASFVAYTDAEHINNDEVTIIPKLNFSNGNVAHEFKPLTLKTYGGTKVNFSAGYFLNFAGNDNYSTFANSSGNKEVAQGNKDAVTNAIGGLMHVYRVKNPEKHSWFPQLGWSFGASLSDNANIGFYVGPSLFFIEKNRLVVTGGYSYIKLNKINKANLVAMEDSKNYAFANSADTEIRYDSVYRGAWFIGVTYNLSK